MTSLSDSTLPKDERPVGLATRWSDRLNPILVREVQQAIKGRVFVLTVFVSLAITVAIGAMVVGRYDPRGGAGRTAFHAGFATLMPLLLFIVPMQAYQSMRLELRAGIAEQLLLSRLRPMGILLGKIQAAMVQFVLYVAVLSPLLATSYLLRGVDLPTVAVSLLLAALLCVTATALAVSSAAQAVLPGLQPIANLATAFGLGMAAFGFVGFVVSGQYTNLVGMLLRSDQCAMVMTAIVLSALAGGTLALLMARSFLLHAFENKSTAFRVFLFVLPLVVFAWTVAFIDAAYLDEAVPAATIALLILGITFGVFMVTEQRELSPRLRAHAPTGLMTGVLAAPFLPGRDRGMLCLMVYATALALVAWLAWPAGSSTMRVDMRVEVAKVGLFTLTYTFVYLGLARWLRGRLPAGLPGNHLARFLLPVSVFLFILVPVLIDLFTRGEVDDWHVGHVMNPFWTIEQFVFRRNGMWQEAETPLLTVLAVALLLQVPACVRGVREVLAAGAVRKSRQQGNHA